MYPAQAVILHCNINVLDEVPDVSPHCLVPGRVICRNRNAESNAKRVVNGISPQPKAQVRDPHLGMRIQRHSNVLVFAPFTDNAMCDAVTVQ